MVSNMRTSVSSFTPESSDTPETSFTPESSNLCADLSTLKRYFAIEGSHVLGLYYDRTSALKRIEEEKERDFFWLILHKALIKKFLKNKVDLPQKDYYIAEVIETV